MSIRSPSASSTKSKMPSLFLVRCRCRRESTDAVHAMTEKVNEANEPAKRPTLFSRKWPWLAGVLLVFGLGFWLEQAYYSNRDLMTQALIAAVQLKDYDHVKQLL